MVVPIAVCLGISLLSVFALIDGSSIDGATDGRLGAAILGKARVRSLQHSDFDHIVGGGVKGGGGQHRESEWPPRPPTRHQHEQHYEYGHGRFPHRETSQRRQYSRHSLLSHAHPYPHTHNHSVNVDLSHTISSPGGRHPYHTHPDLHRRRPRPLDRQSHYPLPSHPNRDHGRLISRPQHYYHQSVSTRGTQRISGAGWYHPESISDNQRDHYHRIH